MPLAVTAHVVPALANPASAQPQCGDEKKGEKGGDKKDDKSEPKPKPSFG